MKVITIGRSKENNNIIINDEKVSRNHLQIVQDDNGNFTVMDLNSTNGTFVNGKRISGQTVIRPGDEVKIGSIVLPWQGYFASAGGGRTMVPIPFYRKWWTWAVASVVLLLIGGVIWGVCLNDTKQEQELEQQIQNSQRDYDKAAMEYAEAQSAADKAAKEAAEKQAAADRAQAEADRAARKAAESESAKDKKAAADAAEAAKAAKKAAADAAEAAKKAKEKETAKEKEATQLKNQLDTVNKELTAARTELQTTKAQLAKSQRDSRKRLFNNTLKSIKGHEKDFCNKQGWGAGGTKKTIEDKYNAASDDEQQRIVDAMEAFANSIENSNDKKSNAESTPTPTPTPSTDTTKMSKE